MNLSQERVFKLLKENILLIIVSALLVFGIAFGYAKFFVKPVYYSDAKMLIEAERNAGDKSPTQTDLNVARMMVNTYIEILNTNLFFTRLHSELPARLQAEYTPADLRKNTTLKAGTNTEVISVSFTSSSPQDAKQITSGIISLAGSHVADIYTASVKIVEEATEPQTSTNKIKIFSAVGFIGGGALAVGVLLLRELSNTKVKSEQDLTERFGVTVIGSIPNFNRKKKTN